MALTTRMPERDTARAMSQENVDVVGQAWKAFNDGGIDGRPSNRRPNSSSGGFSIESS